MTSTPQTFWNVTLIAETLASRPRNIFRMLRAVPSDHTEAVRGKDVRFWSFYHLPAHLQKALDDHVRQLGYANALHYRASLQDGQPPRQRPVKPASRKQWFHHRVLDSTIEDLNPPGNPITQNRDAHDELFHAVFLHYKKLLARHTEKRERKALKRSLVDYLFRSVPGLSRSNNPQSWRRVFDDNFKWWTDHGETPECLADQRPLFSGNFRRPEFAEDVQKLKSAAYNTDGNESLAQRLLIEKGELSDEYQDYYKLDPRRDKSYVPRTIRAEATPPKAALLLRHSDRALQLAGPYTSRDWSDTRPGEWFTADDVTWNHYFREKDQYGRWQIIRGECLLLTDARTDYPIEFLLIAGHYNSGHIRQLMLLGHDSVGLSHLGYYLERGVWDARLVVGDYKRKYSLPWTSTLTGLNAIGRKVMQAKHPKGKIIEGAFNVLQDRMRCIPGFVGKDEALEKREAVQKLIARARRQDDAAVNFFPTQQEWRDQIRAVLEDFKHDPQNGHRLNGKAPAEAWDAETLCRPLEKLKPEERWKFSTHGEVRPLTTRGITLQLPGRKQPVCFANDYTGAWLAAGLKEVVAHYHVEWPELVTVTDLKRQNFFPVKALMLPATTATPDQIAEVERAKRAHLAPIRALAGELKHSVISTVTRDAAHADEASDEFGRFDTAAIEAHKSEQTAISRKLRKLQRDAAQVGASVSAHPKNLDRAQEGVDWERDILERLETARRPGSAKETES